MTDLTKNVPADTGTPKLLGDRSHTVAPADNSTPSLSALQHPAVVEARKQDPKTDPKWDHGTKRTIFLRLDEMYDFDFQAFITTNEAKKLLDAIKSEPSELGARYTISGGEIMELGKQEGSETDIPF